MFKYYSIAFAILPSLAGGLALELFVSINIFTFFNHEETRIELGHRSSQINAEKGNRVG